MKKIELKTRYGDILPLTRIDGDDYYTLNVKNVAYVSAHYDNDELIGIDPEGLHIISVGSKVPTTDDTITSIRQYGSIKYRLYVTRS